MPPIFPLHFRKGKLARDPDVTIIEILRIKLDGLIYGICRGQISAPSLKPGTCGHMCITLPAIAVGKVSQCRSVLGGAFDHRRLGRNGRRTSGVSQRHIFGIWCQRERA